MKTVAALSERNSKYESLSLLQTTYTAIRLSGAVIDCIVETDRRKDPSECLVNDASNKIGARSVEEIKHLVDCRPYEKFLNTAPLQTTTVFTKAWDHESFIAQINAIHQCRDNLIQNSFRTAAHTVVANHFTMAALAFQDKERFLKYVEEEKWLTKMHTLKTKLIRNTELNEGIEENQGNVGRIFRPLLDSFFQHHRTKANSISH